MFSQQDVNYLALGVTGQAVLAALAALLATMQSLVNVAGLRGLSGEHPLINSDMGPV